MRRIIILLVVVVSALLVRTHVAQNIFNCAELISSRLWYNLLERYYAQFTWGKESLRRDDSEQRGRQRTLTDVPMPTPPPKSFRTPTGGKPFLIPSVRIYFTRHAQSMSNAIVDRSPSTTTTKESNSPTVVIMMRKLLHSVLALLKIVPIQTYHLLFAQQGGSLMVDYPVTGLGMEQIGRFAYNNRDIKGTVRSSEMRSVFLNTIPPPRRKEDEDGALPNLVLLTSNLRRAQQTAIGAYGSLMEQRRALMSRKQQKEVEERGEPQRGGCDDNNNSNEQRLSFIVDPLLQECSERVDRKWSASTAASGTSSHWHFLEDIFSGYAVDSEHERCALDRHYHELHGGKMSMEGNDWITVWERMDRFVEKIFMDSPENYFRYEQQQKGFPNDDQNGAEGWKSASPPTVVVVGHGSYINKFFARYAADVSVQDDQSKVAAESGISNLQTIKVDLEINEQTGQPQIIPGSVESVYGSFKE